MEIYFEHLINATYRAYQDILIKKHGDIYPLRSAIIKFGGFHLSYDWYGRTRLGKEEIGNLVIFEAFLWTLPEIKELERLQSSQWEQLAKNLG